MRPSTFHVNKSPGRRLPDSAPLPTGRRFYLARGTCCANCGAAQRCDPQPLKADDCFRQICHECHQLVAGVEPV